MRGARNTRMSRSLSSGAHSRDPLAHPGYDRECNFSFSRRTAPELCKIVHPQKVRGRVRPSREGAGNAGCPMHPWPQKMR
jgi:hypothetical protein